MDKIKLRHFNLFLEPVNKLQILKEAFGFEKLSKVQQLLKFNRLSREVYSTLQEMENIKFEKLLCSQSGRFKLPSSIDLTSFGARQDINQLLQILSKDNNKYTEGVATIIAIACYEEIYKEPFKEDYRFKILRHYALDLPLTDAIGLSNEITNRIVESSKIWNDRFKEVEMSDPDFTAAGGHILGQFSTIQVMKYICRELNTDDKGAWNMSFVVVQTALLEKQSADFIQKKMTKIKERRLKAQQQRNKK